MKAYFLILLLLFCPRLCAQFYEDFENTTGPDALPSTNWTLGSGNWTTFSTDSATTRWDLTTNACNGNGSAFTPIENIGIGNTSHRYLVSAPIFFTANNDFIKFKYNLINPNNQNTTLKVHLTLNNPLLDPTNPSNYSLLQIFDQSISTSTVCQDMTIDLSAFLDVGCRIIFEVVNTQTSVEPIEAVWYIDDVGNSGFDPNAHMLFNPFVDINGNGILDTAEPTFSKGNIVYQVNNSGINQNIYSNYGYYLSTNTTDIYDVSFNVDSDYSNYFSCSTSFNDISNPSIYNQINIPINITNPLNDVEINIIPDSYPRAGFNENLHIYYKNNSNQIIPSGTITFLKDINQTISSTLPAGAVINSTGFTYDFTNLGAFEERDFYISLYTPPIPTVSLGQLLSNSISIQIPFDDILSNNSDTLIQPVVASYDPNDKLEAHGGKIAINDFNESDYLTYAIRFENTGNADAINIRLEDVLNSQLDETTFKLINASHNVSANRNNNELIFNFKDINLPPSNINPEESHGYVTFKIKPKPGYAVGDIIPNTAEIYFDYNPAIITNTFNTEFVQSLSNVDFNENSISLNPNPAKDYFTINNIGNEKISGITIYEISGKKVFETKKSFENQINIDVSNFARGIYLVEIVSENKSKLTKKLILK